MYVYYLINLLCNKHFKMIIIYDGQCLFCTKTVSYLKKETRKNITPPELYNSREKAARQLLHKFDVPFVNYNTIYCINMGKVFIKSRAVFAILQITRFPIRLLTFFKVFPISFTDKVYDFIAKNRYRISKVF